MTISSVAALAPIPLTPAYSLSKAAAFNLTQALRMLLAGQGVRVHAALCGPVDTEMVRDPEVPKTPPETVATAVFDGVDRGEEDIFPDPLARRCPTAGTPAPPRHWNARTRRSSARHNDERGITATAQMRAKCTACGLSNHSKIVRRALAAPERGAKD